METVFVINLHKDFMLMPLINKILLVFLFVFISVQADYQHLFHYLDKHDLPYKALMTLSIGSREALNKMSVTDLSKHVAMSCWVSSLIDLAEQQYQWKNIDRFQFKKEYLAYISDLNRKMIEGSPEIEIVDKMTARARAFQIVSILKQKDGKFEITDKYFARAYYETLAQIGLLPKNITSSTQFVDEYLRQIKIKEKSMLSSIEHKEQAKKAP
jgi:hypothetical protein